MMVMEGVCGIYLSKEFSVQLSILYPDFPKIGGAGGDRIMLGPPQPGWAQMRSLDRRRT